MRRILITGITGFVGSHLADFALEADPVLRTNRSFAPSDLAGGNTA
jgi:nucleoside-diphosphate-sugar epimerase